MRVAIVDVRAAAVRSVVAETTSRGPRRVMDRTVAVGLARSLDPSAAGLVRSGVADVLLETARRLRDAHDRLGVTTAALTIDADLHAPLAADGVLDRLADVLGASVRPHHVEAEALALQRGARHHGALDDRPALLVDLGPRRACVALAQAGRVLQARHVPLRDLHQLGALAEGRPDAGWLDVAVAAVAPLLAGWEPSTAAGVQRVVLTGAAGRALARAVATREWRRPLRAGDRVRLTAAGVLGLAADLRGATPDTGRPGVDGLDARDASGAAVMAAGLLAVTGADAITCTDADRVDGHLVMLLGTEQPTPLPLRVLEATGDPTPRGRHVAALAVTLFDGLREVTGLDDVDRDVLEAAALVHDIARAEGAGHHRRAGERVLDLPVRGVEPGRLVEVACVVRSQRGRAPGGHVPVFLRLPSHRREAVTALVALLRLAVGLDRGGDGAVTGLGITVEPHPGGAGLVDVEPRLVCIEARGDRLDLALYGARGAARYAEQVLGARLVVRAAGTLAAAT